MEISITRLSNVIVIGVGFQGDVVKRREQDPMPM